MSHKTLTMMGVLAFAATTALAQQPSSSKAAASSGSTAALTAAEKRFVMEAARGGLAEVEMGRLASEKAQNEEVKSFGKMMVDDHSKANDELKKLASDKGVTVPTVLDAAHKAKLARLEKLSGEQFDRAYMQEMVKDHKKDVGEFRRESTSARDKDLKDWAGKTLPTLEKHLQHAEQAAGAVGVSTASGKAAGRSTGSRSQKKGTTAPSGR